MQPVNSSDFDPHVELGDVTKLNLLAAWRGEWNCQSHGFIVFVAEDDMDALACSSTQLALRRRRPESFGDEDDRPDLLRIC